MRRDVFQSGFANSWSPCYDENETRKEARMERRMTFDQNPIHYDRHRPGYAGELYREIFRYSGLDGSMRALEIGIGTGLATEPILETGCEVIAVEAGRNLARYVEEKFAGFPNFRVVRADFESFEPEERFDLIYSATAFHWIPEEIGLPKVYRLLNPSGAAALFWNRPFVARPDDPLHRDIRKIYRKYRETDSEPVEFSERDCQKTLDALTRYGFQDVECHLFHRTRTMDARDYGGLLTTYSDHQAMGEQAMRGLIAEIEAAIEARGGEITIYDTMDLYLGRKSR
jgi:ubiquinone/menaquinone biosynthesis C-methylase UbiE